MGRPPGSRNKTKPVRIGEETPPKVTKFSKADEAMRAALEEDDNMLHIPPEIIPDGMRYNWKTFSVLGMQQSRRYGRYEATGWSPVPASRHPGLFTPKGYEGQIEYDGLVLMEKPEELCRQTEAREFLKARQQVQAKEQQLRGGDVGTTLDGRHRTALQTNKINKSYERIDIPD